MKRVLLTLTLVLFIAPITIAQDLPSYIPTDGLVAYYPFNGNANDESGNGHHATVNGAILSSDRDGNNDKAYEFSHDGASFRNNHQSIYIPFHSDFQSENFTVSIWFKADSYGWDGNSKIESTLISKRENSNDINQATYRIQLSSSFTRSEIGSNTGSDEIPCTIDTNPINLDAWYHAASTYDGVTLRQYINGVKTSELVCDLGHNAVSTSGIMLGQTWQYNGYWYHLDGKLDEFLVYNKAMTEQEMENYYVSATSDILLNGTVSAENNQIKNVADPTDAQDVVTKSYLVTSQSSTYSQQQVDQIISNLQEQINALKAQSVNYGSNTFSSIIEAQNSLKPTEQIFTISDNTVSNTIQGINGTVININPNAITLNGNPYTGAVKATLDEYLTPNSMILSGIQTTSNGELLVTGGSFELDLEGENGEDLELSNWSANASMPLAVSLSNDFKSAMRFYVGERLQIDGREQVNWELNDLSQEFRPPWQGFSEFYGINLGLSNCDVLYSSVIQGLGTQFSVLLEGVTDYNNAIVWMFINDFPSVVQITSLIENEQGFKTYADSIPVGLNATLLAIYVDEDDYLKFGTLEINVQGDEVFTIPMSFGTKDSLKSLIENF